MGVLYVHLKYALVSYTASQLNALLMQWQISFSYLPEFNTFQTLIRDTVKILKFGTPQTIAIIILTIEKFDVTLH